MSASRKMNTTYLYEKLSSRSRFQVNLEFSVFILVNIVAFLGNILVCWVFFRNRRLRQTVTNIYIIALAVSDVLFATLCLPFVHGVLWSGEWLYPRWVCQIHGFVVPLLCFFSMYTIALTALNRYFRVVQPNTFKKIFTKRYTLTSVLVVLLVAACLLAFPIVLGWASLLFHPGKMICTLQFYDRHIDIAYSGFLAVAVVLSTFVTITISYQRVFKAVEIHKRSRALVRGLSAGSDQRDKLTAEEIKLTITLFGIVLGFSFCWAPVFVIEFVDSFRGPGNELPLQVYFLYSLFVSVSAAINPILYGALNRTFRTEYIKILRSRCNDSGNAVHVEPEKSIRLRKFRSPIKDYPKTLDRAQEKNKTHSDHYLDLNSFRLQVEQAIGNFTPKVDSSMRELEKETRK